MGLYTAARDKKLRSFSQKRLCIYFALQVANGKPRDMSAIIKAGYNMPLGETIGTGRNADVEEKRVPRRCVYVHQHIIPSFRCCSGYYEAANPLTDSFRYSLSCN